MKPERKVVTSLRLDEISAVHRGAVEGAVVAIMKSADGNRIKPVTKLKNIELTEVSLVERGANQFANVAIWKSADEPIAPVVIPPTAAQETQLRKILAAIRGETTIQKSQTEESSYMSETHYERLTKNYAQRHGVSITKAAEKLMVDDPDSVADAYNADEEEAIKRRFAEANRQ